MQKYGLMVFHPTLDITPTTHKLSTKPVTKMRDYMKPLMIVRIIRPAGVKVDGLTRHCVEVKFPWQEHTDLVSPDYLHTIDSPDVNKLINIQRSERSKAYES
jgi:hypothetical protein